MTSLARSDLWIILPPCQGRAAWRRAIENQAYALGYVVFDAASGAVPSDGIGPVVVICDQIHPPLVAGVDQTQIIILLGRPGYDEESAEPQQIENLTRYFLDAHQLESVRKISLPRRSGQTIDIAPDFIVVSPETDFLQDARSKAFSKALTLVEGEQQAEWEPSVFNYDVRSIEAAMSGHPFDITGRPRFIFSGPYIVMRPGRWRATIKLSFDDGASRSRFRVDWGGVETYEYHEFTPYRSGYFEIVMEHEWTTPAPSEVRLVLLEGLFDGHISFGGVEILQLPNINDMPLEA